MNRPQQSMASGPAPSQKFSKIEADEIHVGHIVITKTSDGGAGIWFGDAHDGPMISLFQCSGQVGIGIYAKGAKGPTNICLSLDQNGAGFIQFAKDGGDVVNLTFDDVMKLDERGG